MYARPSKRETERTHRPSVRSIDQTRSKCFRRAFETDDDQREHTHTHLPRLMNGCEFQQHIKCQNSLHMYYSTYTYVLYSCTVLARMELCKQAPNRILRFKIHNTKFSVMHIFYTYMQCACIHCRLRCCHRRVFTRASQYSFLYTYIYMILICLCIFASLIIIHCVCCALQCASRPQHSFVVVVVRVAAVNFRPLVHFSKFVFFVWPDCRCVSANFL